VACRVFDAQVVHTPNDSPRGKLLDQFVCVRITDMTGVDIALFDYDRHNALYYFVLNTDEQIYLRYGGRDETSPDAYLDLESLELALAKGLELHKKHQEGQLQQTQRPDPRYPQDIPLIKQEVVNWGRCVECHLIRDYELLEKEYNGTLNRFQDIYRYPDIRRIGIELDVPKGLVVKQAAAAVADAGMRSGDTVTAINAQPVYTFGDLQHYYDKVPKNAASISLSVERGGEDHTLNVALPNEWWYTDLYHRYLTVDPNPYFSSHPLTTEEKTTLGLNPEGFASEVTHVDPAAQVYMLHTLQQGDIIYAVDGLETNLLTNRLDVHIKLHVESGSTFTAKLLRNGEKMEMTIGTYREHFRKPEV
jgi:C-terminal processing protease CtpA/Prc